MAKRPYCFDCNKATVRLSYRGSKKRWIKSKGFICPKCKSFFIKIDKKYIKIKEISEK